MNVCVQLLLYRVVRSYTGSQVPVGVPQVQVVQQYYSTRVLVQYIIKFFKFIL
jgi:hypothetical protein